MRTIREIAENIQIIVSHACSWPRTNTNDDGHSSNCCLRMAWNEGAVRSLLALASNELAVLKELAA